MRLVATRKDEQNAAAADPWTMVHLSAGLALGLMGVPLRWALAASTVYEMLEQVFERGEWAQDLLETSRPESFPNALVDVLIFSAGHRLGVLWNRTGDAAGRHSPARAGTGSGVRRRRQRGSGSRGAQRR